MKVLELMKAVRIDFTQGLIVPDAGTTLDYRFSIMPWDFLSYSKQDLQSDDERANINALTNAKRAIDCQTDKIMRALKLNPSKFPKALEEFVSKSKEAPKRKDLPAKLRFLQAIGFAPAGVVANVRLLRNKLEHSYRRPSDKDAAHAIELAELFILATDKKLDLVSDFMITDKEKYAEHTGYVWNTIYVSFRSKKGWFELRGYTGQKAHRQICVRSTSIEFYHLLRVATSFDYANDMRDAFTGLLDAVSHPIPKGHINVSIA